MIEVNPWFVLGWTAIACVCLIILLRIIARMIHAIRMETNPDYRLEHLMRQYGKEVSKNLRK